MSSCRRVVSVGSTGTALLLLFVSFRCQLCLSVCLSIYLCMHIVLSPSHRASRFLSHSLSHTLTVFLTHSLCSVCVERCRHRFVLLLVCSFVRLQSRMSACGTMDMSRTSEFASMVVVVFVLCFVVFLFCCVVLCCGWCVCLLSCCDPI